MKLLTKNSEFHIYKNSVFSITDLYVRDFLFLKGFHDGFTGDSPLISRNTEFAMKFRSPWRSINWSFCRYFHSLLLWVGHTGHVCCVWQLGLIWCKHLAKPHHCEPVNTGRGRHGGWGKELREKISVSFFWYPLRVLNKDVMNHWDLNLWALHWKGHKQLD